MPQLTVLDDNSGYAGYGLYTSTRFFGALPARPEVLARTDTVIVTAYLHDDVISRKLRAQGFSGSVFTIRVAPDSPAVAGVRRIFRPLDNQSPRAP